MILRLLVISIVGGALLTVASTFILNYLSFLLFSIIRSVGIAQLLAISVILLLTVGLGFISMLFLNNTHRFKRRNAPIIVGICITGSSVFLTPILSILVIGLPIASGGAGLLRLIACILGAYLALPLIRPSDSQTEQPLPTQKPSTPLSNI